MMMKWMTMGFAGVALLGAVAYPVLSRPTPEPVVVGEIDVEEISLNALAMDLDQKDRVWERIPWVKDLDAARALSAQTDRPIFLFSMWGELDSRC